MRCRRSLRRILHFLSGFGTLARPRGLDALAVVRAEDDEGILRGQLGTMDGAGDDRDRILLHFGLLGLMNSSQLFQQSLVTSN